MVLEASIHCRHTVIEFCDKRKDDWAVEVKGLLQSIMCLPAEEAVYHKNCHLKFTANRIHPNDSNPISALCGATNGKCNKDKQAVFDALCEWLETAD